MVVSDHFLWLHIPKTAGDATLRMFEALDHPWRLIDPHSDARKHGTLADAHERVPGAGTLAVIANLRRLPEMALSYFHHMQRHDPTERFANGRCFGEMTFREYLHFVIEHPQTQSYDWHLDHFLGAREADHWLLVSDLAESFVRVIGRYVAIPPDTAEAIREVRANVGGYARADDPSRWYDRSEMISLYRNCPRWSRCERREYGNLLYETLGWNLSTGIAGAE
ncbi:hypothetical protein KJ059_01210 [Myxococcota bacterium]|nr:hypothetical protein [Myxococcota bacterium]